MDDAESLHVLESTHELYGESSDEPLLKASVVVHLDELIEIEAVQVEGHAQVVPEHKVILNLYHALLVLWVVLLYQQQQFSLNCRLVVVLLLILNEFHSDHLLCLVVETLEDLSESALPDLFYDLEPEANLIILRYPVVAISIIISVINDSLSLSRVYLVLIRGKIEYLLELEYLRGLGLREELRVALGSLRRTYGVLDPVISGLTHVLHRQLLPLRGLGYNLTVLLLLR